ncbi:MAG: hypothetical protein GY796_15195 [Chloroflexi bacterium]|nr:hypothetical protein [Chloroflexota bacterium]
MLKQLFTILIFLIFLMGCGEAEQATPTVLAAETAVIPPITTVTPPPVLTPTPGSAPTPVQPNIAVADQVLTDEGIITIASVTSTEPGWVVVYARDEAELGEVLGFTAVDPGTNSDVPVQIDPFQATLELAALLHIDLGQTGEFEFPEGPDIPIQFESGLIATTFIPEFQLSLPVISISDQEVLEDGLVHFESVLALQPGWLLLYANDKGQLGPYLGSTPLEGGLNEDLVVHIPWREATPLLFAVIYEDNGRSQQLDINSGEDVPFLVNGEPIVAAFKATYPPDLFIYDQPIVNGKLKVERVISNGPSWLVVYYDDEGSPGLIIGYAALADGLNEDVEVEVIDTAVTEQLHILIHEDTEPGDAFDFPRVDPRITYHGRQPLPYTFNNNPGKYMIVRDQSLVNNEGDTAKLLAPVIVTDVPTWLALYADNDGHRGEILGQTRVMPGLSEDIVVEVPAAKVTETIYAILHLDAEPGGEFDPENGDVPLQRNRRNIELSFMVEINDDP